MAANQPTNPVAAAANNAAAPLANIGKQFSDSAQTDLNNASSGFLKSNGFIAKFGFILLVIIACLVIFRLGTMLISSLLMPKDKVYLLYGMIDSTKELHISQNPTVNGSKPTYRSDNEDKGIEFTWSVWINVKDLGANQNYYKHIFHKGNSNVSMSNCSDKCGINTPNNSPGLYLNPNTNDLTVVMNTYNNMSEEINVPGIPLNKWINIIIRCEQNFIDVYVNGAIVKRHELSGVPKQNYGDVYMSLNGGFNGYTSNLLYNSKAISTSEILDIINKGPDLTMKHGSDIDMLQNTKPPYLSMRWYIQPDANDN